MTGESCAGELPTGGSSSTLLAGANIKFTAMSKEMFINAVNEIELPQYATVNHVEYPAPDETEDYEGTAPQYWITVDERNIPALEAWCKRNNCDLFE